MSERAAAENQEEKVTPKLSLDGLEEGSPQWKHKKRLIQQEAKRRKNAVVVEEWIELLKDASKKGPKVRLLKKMKNGNVHSFYLGRHAKGGKEAILAYAQKGVFVDRKPPKDWEEKSKGVWGPKSK